MEIISLNEMTSTTSGFEVFEEAASPVSTWKNIKIRGVFQRADAVNQNGRVYPYAVLQKAINESAESLSQRNMFGELDHPCFQSPLFQVLSTKGWKNFSDIKVGDSVWSLKDGKAVISTVEGIIDTPYSGDMYTLVGKNINTAFTAPHKVLLAHRPDGKTTGEFKVTMQELAENRNKYYHTPIPKSADFSDRECPTTISIPAASGINHNLTKGNTDIPMTFNAKAFAAFMGIYLAEGCCDATTNRITIAQVTSWSRDYIKREVLSKLHPELKWKSCTRGFTVTDARLSQYLKQFGDSYTKYVPDEIKALSTECLQELIFWFCIGDGRMVHTQRKSKIVEGDTTVKEMLAEELRYDLQPKAYIKRQVFSVSKQLIDDLHECLVLAGGSGSITTVVTEKDYKFADHTIKAADKVPLYNLNISNSKYIWLHDNLKIEKTHHDGNVYCLTTTHGNFYARQNGKAFWTGNCDSNPLVSLKNVSHVVTGLKFIGKEVIGEAIVFDDPGPAGTPAGRLLGALIRNGCTVGISSRGMGALGHSTGPNSIVEQYQLVTFDCVHNPSTHKAYITQVNESRNMEDAIKRELARKAFIDSLRTGIRSALPR